MFLRLLILLTLVPLVEVVILFRIAAWLEWGPTIGLVVVTGVLGAWLARREGLKALQRIQADLNAGVMPAGAIVNGVLILAAGLVLVTPGVLTDLCGFGLLIPPIRAWVQRRLTEAFKKRIVVMRRTDTEPYIDVEATGTDADEPTDDLIS